MITEKEIIQILNEWEFGANLKNGEFVRGVKNEYYKDVARAIVSKNESLHLASQQSKLCEGKCGMSYCDENGCIDRKRNLVEPKDNP